MLIKAYATLRDLLGWSRRELALPEPRAIGEVLRELAGEHPALGDKLWNDDGRLAGYVTVLVNGRSIEYLAGEATPVGMDDVLSLFPPVGGG